MKLNSTFKGGRSSGVMYCDLQVQGDLQVQISQSMSSHSNTLSKIANLAFNGGRFANLFATWSV